MAATRVYILAKELGVKSSAIVSKCQDEDLDVKNHMSTISAGLAATIREWFSEGENVTTIETTQKVDLKKVRVKKKAKRKPAKKETDEAEQETVEVSQETIVEPQLQQENPELAQVEEEPQIEPELQSESEPSEPEPELQSEPEPEPILPAGPMLEKPKPAKLTGPTVVRVEKAEPLQTRPPRRTTRPRYNEPVTEPLMQTEGGADKKSARPKKHKEKTPGKVKGTAIDAESIKKQKFNTLRRQRDLEERRARLIAAGGEGARLRPTRKISSKTGRSVQQKKAGKVTVDTPVTVKGLSSALGVKASEIITKLMQSGVMATANQTINPDAAEEIAIDFGFELIIEHQIGLEEQIEQEFKERERKNLTKRPVVATMLGHVDHGKTSLLDKIRSTQVTASEAGGITQHIGAYQVTLGDNTVTFLDTPGHEAFTSMRARGANMTNVVVLVVAADDGVMPQTIEAINHAKAADVPIIVALNKSDLPGCDMNRIYSQLSEHGLVPAEWSGDTEIVKTSAITGEGIDSLLEHIDYISELLDLKADDTIPASGWVVEAKMSSKTGPVATLLVNEGCIKKGDVVLAGCGFGRIKAIKNSSGRTIKTAKSSIPVEITGLNDVPQAGDKFYCLSDINRAKAAAEENKARLREDALAKRTQITLDNLFSQIEAGNVKELNVIIRADVQGSVDVLTKYISDMSTDEVKIKILHATAGGITEGDVVLAEASNAIVIGFNVVTEEMVAKTAEEKGVEIRLYTIIYRITEDLKKSMVGLLEPEEKEQSLGRAVVRNIFKVSKIGTIAGCYVNDGMAKNNAKVRLIRDNIIIRDNIKIESLKHFKDDTREVKSGLECGIKLAKFDDIKVDDVIDFYEIIEVARTL